MELEKINELALKAGAAKFYPAHQQVHEENYVVTKGFLERFAKEILNAKEAE